VPRLRRDPGYFSRQGFEFVGADGRAGTTLSAAALDSVLAGRLRIRQRPGPQNALGDIKFVFPNRGNIYLHHTPAIALFDRDRRDFSHGCIRVDEPVALAGFVLALTAFGIGLWLGHALDGTVLPYALGIGFWSVVTATVAWTLVQRHTP
jgi:murein L,D-transpeptidase YcbB/YkuD